MAGKRETQEAAAEPEAKVAKPDAKTIKALVEGLADSNRTQRSQSAEKLHEVAKFDPKLLHKYLPQLTDALHRPEPQTRWEVLGALIEIAPTEPESVEPAIEGIVLALHDSESSVVREAAFKTLAAYGKTSARRGDKVWPLMDEALRAYHGDSEYVGMLEGLVAFVEGKASKKLKAVAAALVEHDINHPKTVVKMRARRIRAAAGIK